MTKRKIEKSWIRKKLSNPKFRKGYENEAHKLAIAEQIIKLRKEAGLTQAELAAKIGTTGSVISRYENADYNRYEVQSLFRIAQACGGSLKINFEGSLENRAA